MTLIRGKYTASSATFDGAETRRYDLIRRWGPGPRVCWIGLNPSKANASKDDATIRKTVGFSQRWGFGGLVMLNLGSLISTDPKAIDVARWVGDEDDHYIETRSRQCVEDDGIIVLAWGDLPTWALRRQFAVLDLFARQTPLHCIALTRSGAPRHPSRAPYVDQPRLMWTTQ